MGVVIGVKAALILLVLLLLLLVLLAEVVCLVGMGLLHGLLVVAHVVMVVEVVVARHATVHFAPVIVR